MIAIKDGIRVLHANHRTPTPDAERTLAPVTSSHGSRAMLSYVARRLLLTLPTLILVASTVFFLIRLVPGDPAQLQLGDTADEETIAALRQEFGLDRPLWVQFLYWASACFPAISADRSPMARRCCR